MGEADTPGPPAAFDEEDAQAWTEDEAEPTPFPGDPTWAPSPEDEAYGDDPLDGVLSHLPQPPQQQPQQPLPPARPVWTEAEGRWTKQLPQQQPITSN